MGLKGGDVMHTVHAVHNYLRWGTSHCNNGRMRCLENPKANQISLLDNKWEGFFLQTSLDRWVSDLATKSGNPHQ
jgi:hypothetical protein